MKTYTEEQVRELLKIVWQRCQGCNLNKNCKKCAIYNIVSIQECEEELEVELLNMSFSVKAENKNILESVCEYCSKERYDFYKETLPYSKIKLESIPKVEMALKFCL